MQTARWVHIVATELDLNILDSKLIKIELGQQHTCTDDIEIYDWLNGFFTLLV